MTKSQDKNLNILRTKRTFKVKQKAFFIIFKGLSVAKNCLRPESAPLIVTYNTSLWELLENVANTFGSICTKINTKNIHSYTSN